MGEWKEIELGQVCKLKGGYAFKSDDFKIEGVPLVKISNIQDNKTVKSNADVFISENYLETNSNFVLKNGDIVIAMSGATTGKIGKVNEIFSPSFLNQRVGLFQSKDESKVDLELIYQIFSQDTLIQHILGNAGSSAQPNISPSFIENIKIQLPEEKPEQTRIAEILSTADEAIAHTEALIAKYQRIKTGLMQDLLTRGIDENGNIRSKETHQFKDSPLGRIPKDWECDKLISFCQKIQDGTHFSPKTDANGTYKYITSKNIRMGFLDLSNLEFIDEVSHNKIYKRCSVEFGDVLLTKDGASTGNICLNNLNEEFSLLSSVALIRGKRGVLKNEFIFQFFMETNGQKSLVEQMSGNAITRITLAKINNTLIKVPSFHEQELIIQRLKSLDELVNDEKTKLSKLQSLKTGLMQDLLSGKVRVTMDNKN